MKTVEVGEVALVRVEAACELATLLITEGDDAVALVAAEDDSDAEAVDNPDAVEICVPDVLIGTDEEAAVPLTAVSVAVEFVTESLWPMTDGNKRAKCQNPSLEERMSQTHKARQECRRVLSSKCDGRFMLVCVLFLASHVLHKRVITRFHF